MANIDQDYFTTLQYLKEKVKLARQKAVQAVNKELLFVYWEIGRTILLQQVKEGWGAKVIDRLAADLRSEFPDMKGFSVRNIKYMRSFAEAWPQFGQATTAQIQEVDKQDIKIVQAPLAQLSWYHHITLLERLDEVDTRLFYIEKTARNGWSRNVMLQQIENQLHLRQGQAITNFGGTLSSYESDLVRETFKSPYIFDFLGMGEAMQERELEKALVENIKKFMLELGRGFAYVGNQYNLEVENDDYFLDLFFYNYHLHCFVVFELKVGDFKPEYTGKLNFYINTVNAQIKGPEDKPTIGILLCKTPNETVVKYSLQGINTPIGVAEYEFTRALPLQLKAEMPSIEELEQEMEKEIKALRKPLDEKKGKLKEMLARMTGEELKKEKDAESVIYICKQLLVPACNCMLTELNTEIELFKTMSLKYMINGTAAPAKGVLGINTLLSEVEQDWNKEKIGVGIKLTGFKKGGMHAFDVDGELWIYLEQYKYKIGVGRDVIWGEYFYHHQWTKAGIQEITEKWCEWIIDEIQRKAEEIQ